MQLIINKIFRRLDVDGDGLISWWEWQAVLLGTLTGRNLDEKYVDPLDALAVITQAAGDALKASKAYKLLIGDSCSCCGSEGNGVGKGVLVGVGVDDDCIPRLHQLPFIDPAGLSFTSNSTTSAPVVSSVSRLQQEIDDMRRSMDGLGEGQGEGGEM